MNRKSLLTAAIAAALLAAGAAHAESPPSKQVKATDLDLSQPKDVQRLYDRVYEAATEVCGGGPLVSFVTGPPAEYLACRDATVDATLKRFHAPLVLALRAKLNAQHAPPAQ
jgi:UrcA family protein